MRTSRVLVTGTTGFLGKVVLYELLRRRRELGVKDIYVLIRPSRRQHPEARFEHEVVGSACFDGMRDALRSYATPIAGDLTRPNCGVEGTRLATVQKRLTHVFHCAASVEFDLPLAQATAANITSTLNVLELARGCSALEHMVAVSTAYVTPHPGDDTTVPERLVPMHQNPERIYREILEGRLSERQLLRSTGHPNTYTLTKCIAEHLLMQRRGQLPVTILRPSVISASLQHPRPGWIDSYAAFAGFVCLIATGRLNAVVGHRQARLDVIPCDKVADAVVDAGFEHRRHADAPNAPRIRHVVAQPHNSCRVGIAADLVVRFFEEHPVEGVPHLPYVGRPGVEFWLRELAHHTLPTQAYRFAMKLAGRHRHARRAERLHSRQIGLNRLFPYFTSNTFNFAATHDVLPPDFNRQAYVRLICRGVYRHLFGRDESEMSVAGRQHRDGMTDLGWAARQPTGNLTMRTFAYALRKVARYCIEQITYDHEGFVRARQSVRPNELLVIVPTHRSYTDFLLCSYLFFSRPELGIPIPHIAADAQFRDLPLLGFLFRRAQAFYLERGLGRIDDRLTRQIHELVDRRQTLQFFIEGARSRSRQFLPPRRGLLRCLQSTQRLFGILPVAITYDRIPEERALLEEIAGLPKRQMQMAALLRFFARVLRGEVELGRIHVSCGELQHLSPETDIPELARSTMAELQKATAVTTYHLDCFSRAHRGRNGEADPHWLREKLEERGCRVLDSPLSGRKRLGAPDPLLEHSMRYQWLHRFLADAHELLGEHPVVEHQLARQWFGELPASPAANDAKEMQAFLQDLFRPIQHDYIQVTKALRAASAADCVQVTAASLKATGHFVWSPNVDQALDFYVRQQILERGPNGSYRWGPRAAALREVSSAVLQPLESIRQKGRAS